MSSAPPISVLMLAYNHERFTEQAVRSVLAQRVNVDYEIVIGEDCSQDGTRRVLEELRQAAPEKIRVLLRDKNLGPVPNFIETYHACRGEFMAILSCDDYWTDPNKLQSQLDAMRNHPHWSMCFHPAIIREEGRLLAEGTMPHKPVAPETGFADIVAACYVPAVSAFWRKSWLPRLPERFHEIRSSEDWLLHMIYASLGPIGFLNQPMAVYRTHPASYCANQSTDARLRNVWLLYDFAIDYFREVPDKQAIVRAAREEYAHVIAREKDELLDQYRRIFTCWSYRLGVALTSPARLVRDLFRPRAGELPLGSAPCCRGEDRQLS